MSYTEIYVFNQNAQAEFYDEIKNAHRGCMSVWKYFEDTYLEPTEYPRVVGLKNLPDGRSVIFEIWDLVKSDIISEEEKILMKTTFDNAVIRHEELPEIIRIYEKYSDLISNNSLKEQADILKDIYNSNQYIAVAWNQNSVGEAYWSNYYETRLNRGIIEDTMKSVFENLKKHLKLGDEALENFQYHEEIENIEDSLEEFLHEEIFDKLDVNKNYSLKEKQGDHWFVHNKPIHYTDVVNYLNTLEDGDYHKEIFEKLSTVFYIFYKDEEKINLNHYLISFQSVMKIKEAVNNIDEIHKSHNGAEKAKSLLDLDDSITGQYEHLDLLLSKIDQKFFMNRSYNTFEFFYR